MWKLFAVWLLLAAAASAERMPNPLLDELTQRGVRVGDQTVRLPLPTLDGGAPQDARAVVTRVSGRHAWEPFVRDSIVAPFSMKLRFVEDAEGQPVGHTIDLWFVAHGSLTSLRDERWFEGLMGLSPSESAVREIDADVLRELDILQAGGGDERFIKLDFSLLKRVRVEGVGRVVDSFSDETIEVAWELDPRFDRNPDLRNVWRSIKVDASGRKRQGSPQAYQGYGGYAKVTRLPQPPGALFVESHIVLHEPRGWFAGSKLLRSKLPLVMQDGVRKFRRQLTRIEGDRGATATDGSE